MTKVCLITGTSTGLGLSLAVQLAKHGHIVYATMRDLKKSAVLLNACTKAQVAVNVLPLNVQYMESVEECVAQIIRKHKKINCLINNAGAGFVRSTEQASETEIQWVMDVNFMGVVRCTKAVLPHMRAAKSGHIVNVTSVGGLVGQPFNEIYCAAKFAVEGYTESMATYIQPHFNVKFTAIEPGGISSEFANNVMQQLEQTGGMLRDEYLPILQKYINNAQQRVATDDSIYQTPEQVAEIIVECINNPNPPVRIRTSKWANELCQLKTQADPDGTRLQKQVFESFL